jgi:hypothetical protein
VKKAILLAIFTITQSIANATPVSELNCSAMVEITAYKAEWYTQEGCRHLPLKSHFLAAKHIQEKLPNSKIVVLQMKVTEGVSRPFIMNPKINSDSVKMREAFKEAVILYSN